MKTTVRTVLIFVLIIAMTSGLASAEQISIGAADAYSRYVFDMKDIHGTHFTLYLLAPNEQRVTGHTWFGNHSRVFKGSYKAAIAAPGSSRAATQAVTLFGIEDEGWTEGIFDMDDDSLQNSAYMVRATNQGEPDILVVTQRMYATSSVMRAFFIADGELNLIYWQSLGGDLSRGMGTSAGYPLTRTDELTFQTRTHVRSMAFTGYIYYAWKLDPARRTFIGISRIEGPGKRPQ